MLENLPECTLDLCSIKLRSESPQANILIHVNDENVQFCELDEMDANLPPELSEDLDSVLKYFCDKLAETCKGDTERLEKVVQRFKEKVQELVFNPEIFGEKLIEIVKNKVLGIHSNFDREHSNVLINLRNSLIAKCGMPNEIRKYVVMKRTIEEANSRFQERVLMMNMSGLDEIKKAFEDCYDGFIVDRSCIEEEFAMYEEIMVERNRTIIENMSQKLFDHIKAMMVGSSYQWIAIKGYCFTRHASKMTKSFNLCLSPMDAILALKGKYQIEQLIRTKPGICILITSKEKILNNFTDNISTSLLLYYNESTRKALNVFSGQVQVVSGSDSTNLIILHKTTKRLTKMYLVDGRFIETNLYELDSAIIETILIITYNSTTETIAFYTEKYQLCIFNEISSIHVVNEACNIRWMKYLTNLNIFVMINDESMEILNNDFITISKIQLNKIEALFPTDFIENPNKASIALTTYKKKLFLSNRQNRHIYYYKIDFGPELFKSNFRKSVLVNFIDIFSNEVSQMASQLTKDNFGFNKIKFKPIFSIYLELINTADRTQTQDGQIKYIEDHKSD